MQGQGKAVPSFGSFKPPATDRKRPAEGYQINSSDISRHSRLSRKPRRDSHLNRDTHKCADASDIPTGSDLFVIDRKGDKNAAKYGPSKYTVPKYVRGMFVPLTKGSTSNSLSGKRFKSITDSKPSFSREDIHYDIQEPSSSHLECEELASEQDDSGPKPCSNENLSPPPTFHAESPQEKSRKLHEKIDNNPSDVAAWLDLMHLQWDFMGGDDKVSDSAKGTTLARMELAVLERALNASESNRFSLSLTLEELKVAATSGLWDTQRVEDRWQELLSQFAHSLKSLAAVWHAFLDYRNSNSSKFQVDDTVKLYAKAIEALETSAKGYENDILDTCRLDLMKSLTQLLQKAGYTEWGTAILQAELEILVCAARENIPSTTEKADFLDLFCAWWDDDQCHLSDCGEYRGFSYATWKREDVFLSKEQEEETGNGNMCPKEPFEAWRYNELQQGQRLQPRHIDDMEGCPDPYSFVLATDIRDLIFLPAGRPQLILIKALDIFTEYLGMPTNWIRQVVNLGRPASFDENVEYLFTNTPRLGCMSFPKEFWTDLSCSDFSHEQFIIHMPCTVDVLFPRSQKDPRGRWYTILPKLNKAVYDRVVRCLCQVINQQISLNSVDGTIEMYLALPLAVLQAAADDTQSARRVLKQQLQVTPNALQLWLGYIQLELCAWGNGDNARKVFMTVLGTMPSPSNPHHDEQIYELLWVLWIEWEWSLGAWSACWQIIKHAIHSGFRHATLGIQITDSVPLATEKLQIMRSLEKRTKPMTYSQVMVHAIAKHMLQSVPVGEDLQASLLLFTDACADQTMPQRPLLAGKCMMFINMAQCAAKKSKIRTRDLRAVTSQFLECFPDDTCLLRCLSDQTRYDKLHKFVREVMDKFMRGNMSNWKEFHWMELILTDVASGTSVERVRAHFDHAIHIFLGSEQIWKAALAYEVRNLQGTKIKQKEYDRIKYLAYQAIRYCPYSKTLLLMVMDPALDHVFTMNERLALLMTAEEHQIRIFSDPPRLCNDNAKNAGAS